MSRRVRKTTYATIHREFDQNLYITCPTPHPCRRNADSLRECNTQASKPTASATAKRGNESLATMRRIPDSYGESPYGTSTSINSHIGPGTTIARKYELGRKLGEGTFGNVFSATDSRGRKYAVKVEKSNGGTLRNERKIYNKISHDEHDHPVIGIPRLFYFGEIHGSGVMVLEMLGSSLHKLREGRRFSLKTCYMIALQLLTRLEHLHRCGFVHRDLKPDNVLIGLSGKRRRLYLVDYGLTKTFRDRRGKHVESRSGTFVGTSQFSSTNVMRSIRATRRDDLESLGYLLVELRQGELPWSHIPRCNGDRRRLVLECKEDTPIRDLADGFPGMEDYFRYVKRLRFADKPRYRYLRECFETSMRDRGMVDDGNFDWVARR